MKFPVHLAINTPVGLQSLHSGWIDKPLPQGLDEVSSGVTFGAYLNAVAGLLLRDGCDLLLSALKVSLNRRVEKSEIREATIVSQKHGAFYHVAELRVNISGEWFSLAANTALQPRQQAVLEAEYERLERLRRDFRPAFVPRPYALAETACRRLDGEGQKLKIMLGEWFTDHCEFHLTRAFGHPSPAIGVWDTSGRLSRLAPPEEFSLYRQAALILTAYLNPKTFEQIYPWHHASGDFVLQRRSTGISVKLITVRGYEMRMAWDTASMDPWVALAHFFANLALRMRLDRLDGTGELAFASSESLRGIVSGFFAGWHGKTENASGIPGVKEVFDVWKAFSAGEWLGITTATLPDYALERDETRFLEPLLEEHSRSLFEVLREMESPLPHS